MSSRSRAPAAENPAWTVLLAVALLAASTLGLQVSLTRHFSFLYWHHFAFMIIGIGMLGFGAAGAWLARGGGVAGPRDAHRRASASAAAAALAVVGYLWLGPLIRLAPLRLLDDPAQFFQLLLLYGAILVPYTALGLAQSSILAGYREHAHRVYGADLLGAGAGCLLTLALLSRLSATSTLLLWGTCAALAGGLLGRGQSRARAVGPWIVAGVAAGLVVFGWADARLFPPAPSKDINRIYAMAEAFPRHDALIDRTVASSTIRLDVSRKMPMGFGFGGDVDWKSIDGNPPTIPGRAVYQDGAAPTALFRIDDPASVPFLGFTNQGLAYQIRRDPAVCVIGAGGGADVLIALRHGASSVTAVEINPQMLALGKTDYRKFVRGLYERPDVNPVVAEGRHFLARTDQRFDIIQMSGVDTFAALASGAYAMSENYLYTVEAGRAILGALNSDGLFTSSRWYMDPPRETLRLVSMFREALLREGVEDPARHIFVVHAKAWATTLVSRQPFSESELQTLRAWTAQRGWTVVHDPDGTGSEPFVHLLHAPETQGARFFDEYPYDITPPSDDSPFFFQFYRWQNLFANPKSKGGYIITKLPVGYAVLAASLLQMALLSGLFILGPLWSQRSRLRDQPGRLRHFTLFAVLGVGFMGIEITSLQAFTVFLGAPIYSMAITLASLLAATGVGSLWSGTQTRRPDALMRMAVLGITGWVVLTVLLLAPLLETAIAWPLGARAVLVAAWLLPAGLFLGVPFPTAIRSLGGDAPALVPWAWGVNACASVIAALAVVLVSMELGFSVTMLVSAGLYWLGYLVWRPTVVASAA